MSNMTTVLLRTGVTEETRGRRNRPHEDRGRDWSYAAPSQRKPRMASNHGELEEARKDSSLKPQREQVPADTLTLGFWSPELWENKFLLFEATQFFFTTAPGNSDTVSTRAMSTDALHSFLSVFT